MLVIHPGFPKTGTTYLQQVLRTQDWYFGAEKSDPVSTRLSEAARTAIPAVALTQVVRDIAGRSAPGRSVWLSEEAILSPRPYEIAYKIGLYPGISPLNIENSAWLEPTQKLLHVAAAVQGTERSWLLTVRRHQNWCRSYFRYTLGELGARRGAVYLGGLADARAVGGPLFAPTIELIRALDPEAPLVVLPMEALTTSAYQQAAKDFFAAQFGLHVPLTATPTTIVNPSAPPLPATYSRFVRHMTHMPFPKPLRRAGFALERWVRKRVGSRTWDGVEEFEAGIEWMSGLFREDTKVLQAYCPFDLAEFAYEA
jgi:hypothetical protein